jgi:hypothetical protein
MAQPQAEVRKQMILSTFPSDLIRPLMFFWGVMMQEEMELLL